MSEEKKELITVIETECHFSLSVLEGSYFCHSTWGTKEEAQAVADLVNDSFTTRLSAEIEKAVTKERDRLSKIIDGLIDHCGVSECEGCAQILCPWKEMLHTHHDGCPMCDTQCGHLPFRGDCEICLEEARKEPSTPAQNGDPNGK